MLDETKATMMITFSLILSTISLTTYHTVEGTCILCGSVALIGPLNDGGHPPRDKTMVVLQPHCAGTVAVTCQLELHGGQSEMSDYNPRLRMYLTADGKVCELLSQNGSDTRLGEECEDISYTYHKEEAAQSLTFTYYITKTARIDNSVVTCGVNYHPGDGVSPRDCFGGLAALISLDDSTTCNPATTTPGISTSEPTSTFNGQDNSTTLPVDNSTASTSDQPTNSTDYDTEMTTNNETPKPTNPTAVGSIKQPCDNETFIRTVTPLADNGLVDSETFIFTVTPLATVVLLLVLVNVIQCWVIVSRRRRTKCTETEDMNRHVVIQRPDIVTELKCKMTDFKSETQ